MESIRAELVSKVICLELPPEYAYLVLDDDGSIVSRRRSRTSFEPSWEYETISTRLLDIPGVQKVQAHGLTGPFIWITVEVPFKGLSAVRRCIVRTHRDIQSNNRKKVDSEGCDD